MPSPASQQPPLIIGHRGASALAPENTLVAFERAMLDGADGIEFDVRLARDRVPVVIHDATLRRTGLREADVASLSSKELGSVDVGTWFNLRHPSKASREYEQATVPTLYQVFEMFGSKSAAVLYVEMKCEQGESRALAVEVADLLRGSALHERVVVESFNHEAIVEIKRIDSSIRTAALFEPKLARPLPSIRRMIERAKSCRADEIALHRSLASRRAAEEAERAGMPMVVWTVDNPSWVRRARRYGVFALITNNPALMRDGLRAELPEG
ncbi:MAG TPA: glycerophosphodiester phosphodiesterase family protein [Pyrinomonadaceae bacterium]|jgi:glycerophosphoryl diester phosphodiesterase